MASTRAFFWSETHASRQLLPSGSRALRQWRVATFGGRKDTDCASVRDIERSPANSLALPVAHRDDAVKKGLAAKVRVTDLRSIQRSGDNEVFGPKQQSYTPRNAPARSTRQAPGPGFHPGLRRGSSPKPRASATSPRCPCARARSCPSGASGAPSERTSGPRGRAPPAAPPAPAPAPPPIPQRLTPQRSRRPSSTCARI